MAQAYSMYIDGEWVSEGARQIEVINPYNGQVLGTVPEATEEQVRKAVGAAYEAFGEMASMPAYRRAEILARASQMIAEREEEFARTIAAESGKAWRYALGEARRAKQTFLFAAEQAKDITGETVPMDAAVRGVGHIGFYIRVPVGVVAAISPFNFPLNLLAHKVAPAIAAGCTVVAKPATATPITAIKMFEVLLDAGVPPGAINLVIGRGSTVGNWLVSDERVAKISFTGSPDVGRAIVARAGLKKVTMELGNNTAIVIEPDADLSDVIPVCLVGGYANTGQVCISIQRIYVHRDIYDEFKERFVEGVRNLKVGDPLEEDTDVGPLIAETEAIRVESWVNEAVKQGARVLVGGVRDGIMYQPTVLENVTPDMKVMRQEIFGPVVCLIPYDDFDRALDMVNDSKYGLQAGVYTQDINKAMRAVQKLNVGGVTINESPTFRVDQMPYGGVKESGLGREGPKFAIEEMTTVKMVVIKVK